MKPRKITTALSVFLSISILTSTPLYSSNKNVEITKIATYWNAVKSYVHKMFHKAPVPQPKPTAIERFGAGAGELVKKGGQHLQAGGLKAIHGLQNISGRLAKNTLIFGLPLTVAATFALRKKLPGRIHGVYKFVKADKAVNYLYKQPIIKKIVYGTASKTSSIYEGAKEFAGKLYTNPKIKYAIDKFQWVINDWIVSRIVKNGWQRFECLVNQIDDSFANWATEKKEFFVSYYWTLTHKKEKLTTAIETKENEIANLEKQIDKEIEQTELSQKLVQINLEKTKLEEEKEAIEDLFAKIKAKKDEREQKKIDAAREAEAEKIKKAEAKTENAKIKAFDQIKKKNPEAVKDINRYIAEMQKKLQESETGKITLEERCNDLYNQKVFAEETKLEAILEFEKIKTLYDELKKPKDAAAEVEANVAVDLTVDQAQLKDEAIKE